MIRKHLKSAFTLVETLVSLALFMMIMAIVNSIFFQVLGDSTRMASVMSSYDGVRMFSTQISTELGSTMVRTNADRWLNFRVVADDDSTTVFFTAPDDNIRNVRGLNFISHYAYFWNKEDHALYRAVYNTASDPDILSATGSDADNKSRSANQKRLTAMTLAYRSGSPYGWTTSDEFKDVMDQGPHQAIVKNVFGFEVRCYTQPKSEGGEADLSWEDHTSLPLFVELELLVSDDQLIGAMENEMATNGTLSDEWKRKLRRFVITIPLANHDINDNRIYQ